MKFLAFLILLLSIGPKAHSFPWGHVLYRGIKSLITNTPEKESSSPSKNDELTELDKRQKLSGYTSTQICHMLEGRLTAKKFSSTIKTVAQQKGWSSQLPWLETDNGQRAVGFMLDYLDSDCKFMKSKYYDFASKLSAMDWD